MAGPEKIDIQKEVLAKDIERIEELRYHISDKTYDSLRKKRNGKAQQATEIDRQISEMRKEFENKNIRLKQAGIDYIIVNKKHLNDLRSRFMQLSNEERDKALEGIGNGAKIIDEMNNILQHNFNKKMEIARLILAFASLNGEKSKAKEAIEGDQEFAIAQLNGDEATLSKFFNSTDALGFICKKSKGKILICRHEEEKSEEREEEKKESEYPFVLELPGIPPQEEKKEMKVEMKEAEANGAKQEEKKEARQEDRREEREEIKPVPVAKPVTTPAAKPVIKVSHPSPTPASKIHEPANPQAAKASPVQETRAAPSPQPEPEIPPEFLKRRKELEEKANVNVAKMGKEEVEERIKKILTNFKMQRWVLGTFKDDAEREEYDKAQILLVALMKRKREI